MQRHSNIVNYLFILASLFQVTNCTKDDPSLVPPVLVKIGEMTITPNEFISRAEFTPRPAYCRGSSYIHKKIVLNSLIAEKLFALEAGENNNFIKRKNIQAYIKGRREQAMREIQFNEEAYDTVELDSTLLLKILNNSWRTYSISYANFPELSLANSFIDAIPYLDTLKSDIENVLDLMAKRSVAWDETEHDSILETLYAGNITTGEALGPVKTDQENYLVLYVNGWSETPLVSDQEFKRRWEDIAENYRRQISQKNIREIENNLMRGKSIVFEQSTFHQFIKALAPKYIDSNDKSSMQLKAIYHPEKTPEHLDSAINDDLTVLKDQILFTLNDQSWTVQMLENLLKTHPLVFRKDKIQRQEFGEQLKFAIIDAMTDFYLTQKAYDSHYENHPYVVGTENLWKDHINALYEKDKILKNHMKDSSQKINYVQLVEQYLNPVVDSLQNAYSDIIEIDMDLFEDISLSRIDMLALKDYLPYPVTTPSFPLLTNDHILDYGTRTNTAQ
jgi:hypothetical protein